MQLMGQIVRGVLHTRFAQRSKVFTNEEVQLYGYIVPSGALSVFVVVDLITVTWLDRICSRGLVVMSALTSASTHQRTSEVRKDNNDPLPCFTNEKIKIHVQCILVAKDEYIQQQYSRKAITGNIHTCNFLLEKLYL